MNWLSPEVHDAGRARDLATTAVRMIGHAEMPEELSRNIVPACRHRPGVRRYEKARRPDSDGFREGRRSHLPRNLIVRAFLDEVVDVRGYPLDPSVLRLPATGVKPT